MNEGQKALICRIEQNLKNIEVALANLKAIDFPEAMKEQLQKIIREQI